MSNQDELNRACNEIKQAWSYLEKHLLEHYRGVSASIVMSKVAKFAFGRFSGEFRIVYFTGRDDTMKSIGQMSREMTFKSAPAMPRLLAQVIKNERKLLEAAHKAKAEAEEFRKRI